MGDALTASYCCLIFEGHQPEVDWVRFGLGKIMGMVDIDEAKTDLSRLIKEVATGGEVVIAKAGKPLARLVPIAKTRKKRQLGLLAGKLCIPKDFDAPLPDYVLDVFEGR